MDIEEFRGQDIRDLHDLPGPSRQWSWDEWAKAGGVLTDD